MGKLFGALPAIIVCALLVLKPVTSLMNMYYTQVSRMAVALLLLLLLLLRVWRACAWHARAAPRSCPAACPDG
jgi:hypothetical protein